MAGYIRDFYSGMASLASNVAKSPALLYTLTHKAGQAMTDPVGAVQSDVKPPEFLYKNALTNALDESSARESYIRERWHSKGENLTTLIKNKKLDEIPSYLAHAVVSNAPQQIAIAAATLSGLGTPALLALGGSAASESYARNLAEGEDSSASFTNAMIAGAAEVAFERVGTMQVTKNLQKTLAKHLGKEAAERVTKDAFREIAGSIVKGAASEAAEEAATSIVTGISGNVTGVDKQSIGDILADTFESAVIGGLSSATMTAPMSTAGQVVEANVRDRRNSNIEKHGGTNIIETENDVTFKDKDGMPHTINKQEASGHKIKLILDKKYRDSWDAQEAYLENIKTKFNDTSVKSSILQEDIKKLDGDNLENDELLNYAIDFVENSDVMDKPMEEVERAAIESRKDFLSEEGYLELLNNMQYVGSEMTVGEAMELSHKPTYDKYVKAKEKLNNDSDFQDIVFKTLDDTAMHGEHFFEEGMIDEVRSTYFPRSYVPKAEFDNAMKKNVALDNVRHAKKRVYGTLAEAIVFGNLPLRKTMSNNYKTYLDTMYNAVAIKKFKQSLIMSGLVQFDDSDNYVKLGDNNTFLVDVENIIKTINPEDAAKLGLSQEEIDRLSGYINQRNQLDETIQSLWDDYREIQNRIDIAAQQSPGYASLVEKRKRMQDNEESMKKSSFYKRVFNHYNNPNSPEYREHHLFREASDIGLSAEELNIIIRMAQAGERIRYTGVFQGQTPEEQLVAPAFYMDFDKRGQILADIRGFQKDIAAVRSGINQIASIPSAERIDPITEETKKVTKNLYARKDIAKQINNIFVDTPLRDPDNFDNPFKFHAVRGLRSMRKINAISKNIRLLTGLFHHWAFGLAYLMATPHIMDKTLSRLSKGDLRGAGTAFQQDFNPLSAYKNGLELWKSQDDIVNLLIRKGLTLGRIQDWDERLVSESNIISKLADKNNVSKAVKDRIVASREGYTNFLFGKLGAGLKVKSAMFIMQDQMQRNPGMSAEQAAKDAAEIVNNNFGGLDLKGMRRNPTLQYLWQTFTFAPDWTESNFRFYARAIANDTKTSKDLHRRVMAGVLSKYAIATVALNLLMATMREPDDEERERKSTLLENFMKGYSEAWQDGKLNWMRVNVTPFLQKFGAKDNYYYNVAGFFLDPTKWLSRDIKKGETIPKAIEQTLSPERLVRSFAKSAYYKSSAVPQMIGDFVMDSDYTFWRGFTDFDKLIDKRKISDWDYGLAGKGRIKPIGLGQVPSYALYESQKFIPIQANNFIQYMLGELEGAEFVLRMFGQDVRRGYRVKPKD